MALSQETVLSDEFISSADAYSSEVLDWPQNPLSKRTILASIALCALGFIIVAAVIHSILRKPLRLYAALRSEKLIIMDRALQDRTSPVPYSPVFGSSHVNDGFDPRVFDSVLASTPLAVRTLNLAVEGGSQTEQRAMALEYLKTASAAESRPFYLFFELNAHANFTYDHLIHPRAIDIYDMQTVSYLDSLAPAKLNRKQRYGRIGYADAAMLLHWMNLGMLSNWILQPPPDLELLASETANDRRGLHVMNEPPEVGNINGAMRGALRIPIADPQPVLPGNYLLFAQLAKAAGRRKIRPVYAVFPLLSDLHRYPVYPDTIETPLGVSPVLDAARPDLYPEIYQPDKWHDAGHANGAGAALISRILAQQLLDWCRRNPAAAYCGGN